MVFSVNDRDSSTFRADQDSLAAVATCARIVAGITTVLSNDAPKFRRATGESVYFSDQALPNSVAKNQALQDAIKQNFEPPRN